MIIKKAIIIIAVCISNISIAQSTITVEQAGYYIENEIDFPEEINRVIDANNVLTPFVGRWSGVFNGKTYLFNIVKTTETNPYSPVTADRLRIDYNISDTAGNLLFASSSVPYRDMGGLFLNSKSHYYLTVSDSCSFDATVIIIPDYTGQPSDTLLTIGSGFNNILVYLYITPELRYEIPANCVGVQELFPIKTLFLLRKVP